MTLLHRLGRVLTFWHNRPPAPAVVEASERVATDDAAATRDQKRAQDATDALRRRVYHDNHLAEAIAGFWQSGGRRR